MERKPDIQYIHQFYVYGSEAPAIELRPQKKKRRAVLPQTAPQKKIRICIDPMAVCGIVVAVSMLILMAVGVCQYLEVCEDYQVMSDYVIELRNKNVELEQQFQAGYDLEDVQQKAIAIGMIPAEEAEVITISGYVPAPEPEPSIWEEIIWFMKGLFA